MMAGVKVLIIGAAAKKVIGGFGLIPLRHELASDRYLVFCK
jgi:hypothetical protein